jgi:hypothetical protein
MLSQTVYYTGVKPASQTLRKHLLVLLLLAVACISPPQQQPDAQPWMACKPGLGSSCTAARAEGLPGPGYFAICSATEGSAAWHVYELRPAGDTNTVHNDTDVVQQQPVGLKQAPAVLPQPLLLLLRLQHLLLRFCCFALLLSQGRAAPQTGEVADHARHGCR